jgi:putative salt-induced outer membrane protein YdiY
LEEAENYKVRFNSSLQGKLSERISLNLRYEYEYDNAILDKNGRTDRRVTSSLGYSF